MHISSGEAHSGPPDHSAQPLRRDACTRRAGSALPSPLEVSRLCIARIVYPGLIASRKREPKGASFSGFALNANLSLVRFHSKPAKGEPQASRIPTLAATICLSKFIKDVFVLIARYPLAVVAVRNGIINHRALNIYPDCSI